MKAISKLQTRAIWWRLWMWVRYKPIFIVKTTKQPAEKLEATISGLGGEGWQCVHVRTYSERDGKGNHIDMVEVFFQMESHIGVNDLQGKPTEKEKEELIYK